MARTSQNLDHCSLFGNRTYTVLWLGILGANQRREHSTTRLDTDFSGPPSSNDDTLVSEESVVGYFEKHSGATL